MPIGITGISPVIEDWLQKHLGLSVVLTGYFVFEKIRVYQNLHFT